MKKLIKKIAPMLWIIALLSTTPAIMVYAEEAAEEDGYTIGGENGAKITKPDYLPDIGSGTAQDYNEGGINTFIYYFVGALVLLSASLAVFFLFQGGFKYIISLGDEDAVGKAKKTVTWAIFGLLLVIISYQIVKTVIEAVFSID